MNAMPIRRSLLALTLLLCGTLVTVAAPDSADAFHENTYVDSSVHYSVVWPPMATDGGTVVWLGSAQRENGDYIEALKGARLPDLEPFVIVGLGEERVTEFTGFDFGGDLVVWDAGHEIAGIWLSTGERFAIVEQELADDPTVSGDWAVWTLGNPETGMLSVQARNVREMGEVVTLAEMPYSPDGPPAIGPLVGDGGWVAWGEGDSGTQEKYDEIVLHQPGTAGAAVRIPTPDITQTLPVQYELAGGMLVYRAVPADDNFSDNTGVAALAVIDLATGEKQVVTLTHSQPSGIPGVPYASIAFATDGRYLFQSFTVSPGTPSQGDLQHVLAYDLATSSTFSVGESLQRSVLVAGDGVLAWLAAVPGHAANLHAAAIADLLPTAPRPMPDVTIPEISYFPETGHYLGLGFKTYWDANGGLSVFGYPLTEEFQEENPDTGDTYTVQYFERQRYEYHPEHAGTPYEVQLGRLGAQLLTMQGRDWTTFPKADPSAPHYVPETGHAIAEQFWTYWSGHGLDLDDDGVSYRESLALFGYPISEPMLETNADGDTVLTQYFERAVFEHHPDNPAEHQVLLRRVGAEVLAARGW